MTDIDLTDGNTKGRHAQPRGYVPSHLAEPALRDQYGTQLEHVARELGAIRLAADIIADERGGAGIADRSAAMDISQRASAAQRVLRAIASGALVVALALVAAVAAPSAPAQAATVTASVAATESPEPDGPTVQHATKFNRGAWFDQGNGNVYVAAPLLELTARYGWLPSPWETVVVQEQTRRGIRTRGVLTRTNAEGIARGLLHIGGGAHIVRVLHPADLWTLGTTGTWRTVVVTTEPLDVN